MMESVPKNRSSLRSVKITPDFTCHAEGSVLIECGGTRVVCTASVEDKVPPFVRGTGAGWVTAEYGMLPRSTGTRMVREASRLKPSGRTQEISRLIGRSLRSVVDMSAMPDRTIWLDCDVIQADGGTRTASITGAFVALVLAFDRMLKAELLPTSPLRDFVAAVSVGIIEGSPRLDLCYEEDVSADVDMNVVMTGAGEFVEVQGTAERHTFSSHQLTQLLSLANGGIQDLIGYQHRVLLDHLGNISRLFPTEVTSRFAVSSHD